VSSTKEKLLEVAYDLVRKNGVNGMSYKDLSEAVGIRKASIHYHFPKKDDLIAELIGQCKYTIQKEYERIAESDVAPIDKLREIAEIYANGIRANKICVMSILSAENESLDTKSLNKLEISIISTFSVFYQIFEEAKTRNLLNDEYDVEGLTYAFYNLLIGGQIIGRTLGNDEKFYKSVEAFLAAIFK